jgi:hypothetical protein
MTSGGVISAMVMSPSENEYRQNVSMSVMWLSIEGKGRSWMTGVLVAMSVAD